MAVLSICFVRCDSDGELICDAERLDQALAAAQAGETVRLGACRIEGSFAVPAGVTLLGAGPGDTTLVAAGRRAAVRLNAGDVPSRLEDLAVESAGNVGVLVVGTGTAEIGRVIVYSTRGIALAAQGVAMLRMSSVSLRGPVNAGNECTTYAGLPDPEEAPTHGLVLSDVDSAVLMNVTTTGFAQFGAVLVDSNTDWQGGGAAGNLSYGVVVHGGSARLESLDVSGTMDGCRLVAAAGGVFTGGAVVETVGLTVSDNADFGLVHDDGVTVRHESLQAHRNGNVAVWAQACQSITIGGSGTGLTGNRFAGVVAMDTPVVEVADAAIAGTLAALHVDPDLGICELGAGIELVHVGSGSSLDGVTLRNVALEDNEQVGVLVELGGASTEGLTVESVTVHRDAVANPDAYGAVAQGGTVVDGWDDGISRDSDTVARDHDADGPLCRVGPIPDGELPNVSVVAEFGLAAIIDPDPPE